MFSRCVLRLASAGVAFLIAPHVLHAQTGIGTAGAVLSRPHDAGSLETRDALAVNTAYGAGVETERLLPTTLEQRTEKTVRPTEQQKLPEIIATGQKHEGYIRLSTTLVHPQPNLRRAIDTAPPGRLPTSTADDRIRKALEHEVNVHFEGTSLRAVIDQLARQAGIPIKPDLRALADAEIDVDATTVTQTMSGTLRSALRLMLGNTDSTYTVKDGVLLVTSRQCAEENLSLGLYRIPNETDLVRMIELVQSCIQPQTWDKHSGPGAIVPLDPAGGTILLISQTEEVHEEIEEFIAMMPASDVGPHAGAGPLESAATPTRLYAITDPAQRADLEKKLVGLCNAALGNAADVNASVSTLGDHVVVQSKSAAFHAYAADVLRCLRGEEKTTREYVGIKQSDLHDGLMGWGGISFGVAGGGMGGTQGFCWVAREVYGPHDPRWLVFHDWITSSAPDWMRTLYERHGEAWAAWLRDRPAAKAVVRRLMDLVVASRQ